jgi:hypothetical protein
MEAGQESPEYKELQEQIKGVTNRLENDYGLTISHMAYKVGEKSTSFFKYAKGKLPKTKLDKIRRYISELQKLEGSKKLEKLEKKAINNPKTNSSRESSSNLNEDGTNKIKSWVCIYLPLHIAIEPYKGEFEILGIPTVVNELKAIIAEPADSKQFKGAEGLIVVHDPSADPYIRDGWKIAIKRIDINTCEWGKYHFVIDIFDQIYLRRLYKEEDGKYRLVAETGSYPDLLIEKSNIAVVFRVIKVVFEPK